MEVTLLVNSKKTKADVSFARAADFPFVKKWRESVGTDKNPVRTDTVEYADLAVKRYEASFDTGVYANSLEDFADHIKSNPHVEVGGFILLRCDWYPDSEVIGFSHFRRSWCNNMILDYLGAYPFIARRKENAPFKVVGVGSALLFFIGQVMNQAGCPLLWGEATSLSADYYKSTFGLAEVQDLIHVPRENVLQFLAKTLQQWSSPVEAVATSESEAIERLEEKSPPFVGSKVAVFNPSKRLAYRFLQLAYHQQLKIAQAMSCITAEQGPMTREALSRAVFSAAREQGRLHELWNRVEEFYGNLAQEDNPFEQAKV
jgi:hypothetical protein